MCSRMLTRLFWNVSGLYGAFFCCRRLKQKSKTASARVAWTQILAYCRQSPSWRAWTPDSLTGCAKACILWLSLLFILLDLYGFTWVLIQFNSIQFICIALNPQTSQSVWTTLEHWYEKSSCTQRICFTAVHSHAEFRGHTVKDGFFFYRQVERGRFSKGTHFCWKLECSLGHRRTTRMCRAKVCMSSTLTSTSLWRSTACGE